MCGIGGIINFSNRELDLRESARQFSQSLRHRGPDDEGYIFFNPMSGEVQTCYGGDTPENVRSGNFPQAPTKAISDCPSHFQGFFVHRRLSIIDTSPNGHQPIRLQREGLWLTYNGEIYNFPELKKLLEGEGYQFFSKTDSEVLLAAYRHWGVGCLEKFNGMFAFALWDQEKKILFCARDRSGVKPFYYSFQKHIFGFASELKAFRKQPELPSHLNEAVLHQFLLQDLSDHQPWTFLENINELMPAHYLILDFQALTITTKKYYNAPEVAKWRAFESESFSFQKEKLRESVMEAVKLRLRSDVPVGCCLSGGIDSSVISGIMGTELKNFKAFSAIFPGEKIDESRFAKAAAEKSGADWNTVIPDKDALKKQMREMIFAYDLPLWSTSSFAQFCVMKLAAEQGIKVVLDGQGADELFGGYGHHLTTFAWERVRSGRVIEAVKILNASGKGMTVGASKEMVKRKIGFSPGRTALNRDFVESYIPFEEQVQFEELNQHLAYDFFSGRLRKFLRCEDRCGMWHSVESRTPFADDIGLIEAAFGVGPESKIRNGFQKYIFREAMKAYMPLEVYCRKDKIGFQTPHNNWMPELLKTFWGDIDRSRLNRYFNKKHWKRIDQLCGENNQLQKGHQKKEEMMAFKTLSLSIWLEEFAL